MRTAVTPSAPFKFLMASMATAFAAVAFAQTTPTAPSKPAAKSSSAPAAAPKPTAKPAAKPAQIDTATPQARTPLAPPAAAQGLRAPTSPVLIDRVVAIVNREVITASELARREQQFLANLKRQNIASPGAATVREQVLDRMINDRAMLQLARETGIRVDDVTLDRSIARIADQNGLSVAGLRNQLESEGISFSAFRQDIREEIILTRLREREVDNRLQISDSEVDTFLAAQGQSIQRVEELKVAQILVRLPENPSKDELAAAQAKVKRIENALRDPKAFAAVAKEFSDAADRDQGGSLGWRSPDRIPSLFVDAVSGLKPGQISRTVRSANGFHILLLEDRRSTLRTQEVAVNRARHILVRVDAQVSEDVARRRILDIRRRIELGSDFGQMARDFSQDPGSAPKGGELDWAYPGDLVPEFERAMSALQPGQISDPVRSVFGIHLIQLLDRKREPLTEDRLRTAARMVLRDQKLAEAVSEWTREVRANAYVEIKRDDSGRG
jgi:peptidyl-prolyl cis-trans isomerase SurA